MKDYKTLLALSKDERNKGLKTAFNKAGNLANTKTTLQKTVAKLFVAMIAAGDCLAGDLRKHGLLITGEDIREKLQDIYGLVNVFQGVIDLKIDISEAEFDAMDSSKLALLSPFMTKPELKDKLDDAVKAAKTGTAKEIRDLKGPKPPTKADKEVEALKKQLVEVGFVATDIAADAPLVTSAQAKKRLTADFVKAAKDETEAGDTALNEMLFVFGSMLLSVSDALGCSAKEFLDELAANRAKPAATVEVPAARELVAA